METDLVLIALVAVALVALVVPYKLPRLGLALAVVIALAGLLMYMTSETTTASQSGCFIGHCGTVEAASYGLDHVFGGFLLGYAAVWAVVAVIRLARQTPEAVEEGLYAE